MSEEQPQPPQRRPRWLKRPWARRTAWALGVLLALALAVYLFGSAMATRLVRSKLQEMLASQLNARLDMERVTYSFPYTVTVRNAALIAGDAASGQVVTLLRVPEMKLTLAELPRRDGPLVISSLTFRNPSVHLIHTQQGLVGRQGLVRPPDTQPAEPEPATLSETVKKYRLSEMFHLRRLTVHGLSVVYEDRAAGDQSVPVVWRGVDLDLRTDPKQHPHYQFDLAAASKPLADGSIKGQFNLDRMDVRIDKLSMLLTADPDQHQSPAPSALQKVLRDYGIRGRLELTGSGDFPLDRPGQSRFEFAIDVHDAAALLPRPGGGTPDSLQKLRAKIHVFNRQDGGLTVRIEGAEANAADNVLMLKEGVLDLDWAKSRWDLTGASGRVILGQQKEALPRSMRGVATAFGLDGAVDLTLSGGGVTHRNADGKRPFELELKCRAPVLMASRPRLLLTDAACDLLITPGMVEILDNHRGHKGLTATVFGGSLRLVARVRTRKPIAYDVTLVARGLDMAQYAQYLARGDKPRKLSGKGYAMADLSGFGRQDGASALDSLTGKGEFEILDGEFYDLPVLSEIVKAVDARGDAGTVGQAAGVFEIGGRKIRFKKAAVSAPLLGLQGSGAIGFNGAIDFEAVAAPLADWKKGLKKANIPIISDVAAELAGAVQKLLDTASGALLYQFKITGRAADPKITTVPAPVLTENAARLFGGMLKERPRLLDDLKE